MEQTVGPRKTIGLVAHDNKKPDLVEWCVWNRSLLALHDLVATGTTGTLLEEELGVPVRRLLTSHDLVATGTTGTLLEEYLGIGITKLQSGPLGGDLQIGALIADASIDLLVFFWDPLEPQPHDPDVKALLRIAVVWNIPVACNRASADYMISSPLLSSAYERQLPEYESYRNRMVNVGDKADAIDPAPEI